MSLNLSRLYNDFTPQKMKFFIEDFFNKCNHIRSFLRIWSYLLKKSFMENFIFCAALVSLQVNRLTVFYLELHTLSLYLLGLDPQTWLVLVLHHVFAPVPSLKDASECIMKSLAKSGSAKKGGFYSWSLIYSNSISHLDDQQKLIFSW